MDGLYGYWNHKIVRVPMPRMTNHVVMSFDSDHKLLMNVRASGVRWRSFSIGWNIVEGFFV